MGIYKNLAMFFTVYTKPDFLFFVLSIFPSAIYMLSTKYELILHLYIVHQLKFNIKLKNEFIKLI